MQACLFCFGDTVGFVGKCISHPGQTVEARPSTVTLAWEAIGFQCYGAM